MWQKRPYGGGSNWEDAKRYCNYVQIGGYSDWVLPSKDVLEDMIDKKDLFSSYRRNVDFWSSKEHPNVNLKNNGWYFNFGSCKWA